MFARYYLCNAVNKRFMQRIAKFPKERTEKGPELLWQVIEKNNIKTPGDWKNVRSEILNTIRLITAANIDAITVGTCTSKRKYDLAFSYLDFLKEENIQLNLATIGKYFKLLYARGIEETLSPEDEDRIIAMYEKVRKTHSILDSLSLDNIIQALSLTTKWNICSQLLDEMKATSSPSSSSYSAVVAAAFMNNAEDLAWNLLNEMIENNKLIQEIVFISYFKKVGKHYKELEKMFDFMQKNSVKIESSFLDSFVDALKKLNINISACNIHTRGVCKCCNNKLKAFDLTEDEFNDLKTKILQNVIVGKNVYNRTTSDELKKFEDFIANMEKFDIIIDGLNVAYSVGVLQPPHVTSGLVASVVSHFANKGQKVLVLGRKHMNKWPRQNWNYILQNAAVFLTENLSQDDPYLLYCALNSGKDTIIITRDLMRGHKFLLKDVHLKLLFNRWLSQRQYILLHIQEGGAPVFKKPLPFSQIAQKNEGYWHIPCTSNNLATTKQTSTNWLCIKL